MNKKELKRLINSNGFFAQMSYEIKQNAPDSVKSSVPEGAIYFEGIASDGELNRNGYIIREYAWRSAIDTFMKNPIILLQHDIEQPIGQALSAQVTEEGLFVTGYIYDDLTGGKFGRGLYKALSTGHYTDDYEFEDMDTGAILTKEQFAALPFAEQMAEKYVLAVTKLDWVEFSVVSIGSNKKSMVTKKNAILNYLEKNNLIKNMNEEIAAEVKEVEAVEVKEDTVEVETQEQVQTTEENMTEGEAEVSSEILEALDSTAEEPTQDEPETEGENPEATVEVAADDVKEPEQNAKIDQKHMEELQNGSKAILEQLSTKAEANKVSEVSIEQKVAQILEANPDVSAYFANLVDLSLSHKQEVEALHAEINTLKESLDNTPVNQRVLYHTQNKTEEQKKQATNAGFLSTLVKNNI